MKAKDIEVGGVYTAKVSGKLTKVRVDNIRGTKPFAGFRGKARKVYDVTDLDTKRKTTFRSAAKFQGLAGITIDNDSKSTVSRKLSERVAKTTNTAPHLIIEARAGTGKTTTLIEGLKRIKGLESSITPSPQQAAVWESMALSKDAGSICFVAFNKSIATELQNRVPQGCSAMTMHSMGFRAITAALDRVNVNSYRVQDIISELFECDIRDLRKYKPILLQATEKLVGLCKQNLVGIDLGEERDAWLTNLANHYDVDLNGEREEIFALVPRVLERCKDVDRDRCIDFNDMIWLPIALDLPMQRYDLLLVDEAQDLNRCQQALARKAGERLILCGDKNQAIYGFAGADSESMQRLEDELTATDVGCVSLPLTVTYRCGKAIVAEARKYVPNFEAHESNGEGKISEEFYESKGNCPDYSFRTVDGDMVLCRVNAPLVRQCFRFLKMGRKANIQGRDVGAGLISTVEKMNVSLVVDLIEKLSDWLHNETQKENRKRNPNENRLISLQDRYDCLVCFCEDQTTTEGVVDKINSVFTDDKESPGIKLSSVHKAKGLEADRVFILQPRGAEMPHPMAKSAWQKEQEEHILYVAITRAIKELIYVS